MKNWWLALVVVAGCAAENKPDLDATGTVQAQMTYGGGNCAKTGSEPFVMFLAKQDQYGSYTITQSAVGQEIGGNVVCGSVYCEIMFFKSWDNNNYDSFHVDGTLTLDGNDMSITGNGTYSVFGSATGSCEQVVTYAGTLQ
jgi:hypothetical protein